MTQRDAKSRLHLRVFCIVTALVLLAAGVPVAAAQAIAPVPLLALQDATALLIVAAAEQIEMIQNVV